LPGKSEPVAAVVPFIAMKIDDTNVLIRLFLQSKSPTPFFSALDVWKNFVSIYIKHSIRGIGPGNF
jgi:hypothetical protein